MQKNERQVFPMFKNIREMAVILTLLFAFALPSVANVLDDAKLVTIVNPDISVRDALEQVKKQSGVSLMYRSGIVENKPRLHLELRNVTLQRALDVICYASGLKYTLKEDYVLITKATEKKEALPKKKITGIVTDEAGEPLIGAAIYLENGGRATGVITDYNGRYELNASPDDLLVFSYVGMERKLVTPGKDNVINVTLAERSKMLGDVVVTGYQTISKERATGAFDIIKEKTLEKPSVTIADRLVGKVAGVQASTTADGDITFMIRGNGTLQSDKEPLIVVDGFPITTGFASINPNDVANISILKDAAAASIWGARASNGVIVVTTKKGSKEKGLNVEVNAQLRIGSKTDIDYLRNMLSSAEMIDYQKNTFGTYRTTATAPPSEPSGSRAFASAYQTRFNQAGVLYNKYSLGEISENEYNIGLAALAQQSNKQQIEDELLNRPVYQQYNITLSGATNRMTNYVSMLYGYDMSRYKGSDSQNFQFDYRGNVKLLKWLDMNVSAMALYRKKMTSGVTAGDVASMAPYDMILNSDGAYTDMSHIMQYSDGVNHVLGQFNFPYSDWSYNTLREVNGRSFSSKTMNNRFQVGLKATILEGLTFDTKFQLEHVEINTRRLYTDDTYYVRDMVNRFTTLDWKTHEAKANIEKGGILNESKLVTDAYNWRNQLSFVRTFAERHAINFIAGIEVSQNKANNNSYAPVYGYNDDYLTSYPIQNVVVEDCFGEKSRTGIPTKPMFSYNMQRYFSAFANLAYTFDDKYSISGSFRTDASNFISEDPKYRYSPFWSVGFSWHMMKEKFMESVHWIDYLNPRITFGCNGNANTITSMIPLISMLGVSPTTGEEYARISAFGNPQMAWERTNIVNAGIDWSMFNGKFYGKVDFYNKKGTDILADISVPIASGQLEPKPGVTDAMITANAAEVTNRGFEVELGTELRLGHGILWNGNVTLAYNKNKVDKFFVNYINHESMRTSTAVEGYSIFGLWAYEYAGLAEQQGKDGPYNAPLVYIDEERNTARIDNIPNNTDGRKAMKYMGTTVAPWTVGMSHSFGYKNWEMSFTMIGKFGHKFRQTGFNYANPLTELPNRQYSQIKDASVLPMPDHKMIDLFYYSSIAPYMDYNVKSANHVRMQELTLSYSVPAGLLRKWGIGRLTCYLQGNNLFTIKATDEDPEYAYGSFRMQPAYTIGVKFAY